VGKIFKSMAGQAAFNLREIEKIEVKIKNDKI